MALNSIGYLIFFPIILIAYYALHDKYRVYLLTLVSLIMYSVWDLRYVGVLMCIILITWFSGKLLEKFIENKIISGAVLWVNVLLIASFLCLIRVLPKGSIIVPVGISFYSLQAIGYVADVYRLKIHSEKSLIKYALFLSFFPVITSGPIQRTDVLLRRISEEKKFNYEKVRSGLLMVAYGLFAKGFVADRLEYIVSKAYDGYKTETGLVLLIGVITYAFQLYCDFMGYSYIALGSAKALGFDLPDNFRQPYLSTSVREFWGRWHISLSTWLRDYIYYPFGGSRNGRFRTVLNIAIVFLISGIWHGSGLTFVVWGALHGLYRIVEVFLLKKHEVTGKVQKTIRIVWTFILVDFAWLFFRAESLEKAFIIIRRIFTDNLPLYTLKNRLYTFGRTHEELAIWFAGLLIVCIVDVLHEKGVILSDWLGKRKAVFRWTVYFVFIVFMVMSTVYYYGYSSSTFIYSGF